jgi:hypothetical protein
MPTGSYSLMTTPRSTTGGPSSGGLVPETYMPVPREVLPALAEFGVSPDQIEQMLVENPRRILEPREPY